MDRLVQQVTVMGLVSAVVVALVFSLRSTAPSGTVPHFFPIPTSVAFSIVDDRSELDCLRDATWRQDGRYLAVLGTSNDCPLSTYEPGIINIYSSDGKTLIRQLKPDSSIFAALHNEVPSVPSATPTVSGKANSHYASPVLYYHSILWSPDLGSLGATFTAITSFQPLQEFDGLLVIGADGRNPRVLLYQEKSSDPSGYLYLVWGIAKGQPVTAHYVRMSEQIPTDLALNATPALAYTWQEDGTLVPASGTLLTPQHAAPPPAIPGPIGNPDGGSTFTLWQSGVLTTQSQNGDEQAGPIDIYTWSSAFSSWSPDGRYFIDTIEVAGRFQPLDYPVPSQQTLVAKHETSLPLLPVRDNGLRGVLDALRDQSSVSPGVSLAWSTDGRVLAAFGADGINIDFFDCLTGHLLERLPNPGSTFAVDNGIVAWSPNDYWLLLSSGEIISVWNIHSLRTALG